MLSEVFQVAFIMAFPILPLDLLFGRTKHSYRPLKQSVFTKLSNSQHLIKLMIFES